MRRKFILSVLAIPVLVVVTGFLGSRLNEKLAVVNPRVALANDISNPEKMMPGAETQAIKAFRSSGKPASEVISEAETITDKFRTGGWLLGGFIGLVTGLTLSSAFAVRYRKDYTPDKGECFSCAKCTDYCPVKS